MAVAASAFVPASVEYFAYCTVAGVEVAFVVAAAAVASEAVASEAVAAAVGTAIAAVVAPTSTVDAASEGGPPAVEVSNVVGYCGRSARFVDRRKSVSAACRTEPAAAVLEAKSVGR